MAPEIMRLGKVGLSEEEALDVSGILSRGGVIVIPTDTVYAYACDSGNKSAIEQIYRIKSIHRTKPLSFLFNDIAQANQYVRNMSDSAFKIMKRILPGPYTCIFQASKLVPKFVLTKQKTVGVRIPDHSVPRMLVRTLGRPIITTSVITEDKEYIQRPSALEKVFLNQLDFVIDGGLMGIAPSTIVDFSDGSPRVVRIGKGSVIW